jgi:hypothetical protein
MGEVYRARDARLDRDVAVKVLPASFSGDAERLRRFEQEARAAGQINHPGILAIYDVGVDDQSPYVVSELLEGETLRERLTGGAMPVRRAVELARQIAEALAAAHERGIVHRDLKPENLFVTRAGHLKVLDFGLAKLVRTASLEDAATRTAEVPGTDPGTLLGTVGYMSPEQVRSQAVDHRSDIFSFGAILYEMLSGRRAFRGASSVETMNAILKEEPPDLRDSGRAISPALDRVVRHCLEKGPEERFQSARDLAFDLQALSEASFEAGAVAPGRPARRLGLAPAAAVAAGTLVVGLLLGRGSMAPEPAPTYRRVTFRAGYIVSARFAPDPQTIVYGAAWDGQPVELYSSRLDSPESRALGLPGATVYSVSSSGEMALGLGYRFPVGSMLARMPLAGGAPREVLDDVSTADWSADSRDLAVIRGGRLARLEYPIGRVAYESSGYLTDVRVSPGGDHLAFLEHPIIGDTGGVVAVIDRSGHKRTLGEGWADAWGLAWRNGSEVWFSAAKVGMSHEIHAVSLDGRARLVTRMTGLLRLHDITADGRVLLTQSSQRDGMAAFLEGEQDQRSFSWLDSSALAGVSADGRLLLFNETGEGGGAHYSIYVRKTDGSPAVRLGEGVALDLSPDGRWVLAMGGGHPGLVLLPTGPGQPRTIVPAARLRLHVHGAGFFPSGERVWFSGSEKGSLNRSYVIPVSGGTPRPVTPEGVIALAVTADERHVGGTVGLQGGARLYPVDGGEPHDIPHVEPSDLPLRWSADGRSLYVWRNEVPAPVWRLDLATGRRDLLWRLIPSDRAGVTRIMKIRVTPAGGSCIYTYRRELSDLYVVEGLR